jgi:hypothetical protein
MYVRSRNPGPVAGYAHRRGSAGSGSFAGHAHTVPTIYPQLQINPVNYSDVVCPACTRFRPLTSTVKNIPGMTNGPTSPAPSRTRTGRCATRLAMQLAHHPWVGNEVVRQHHQVRSGDTRHGMRLGAALDPGTRTAQRLGEQIRQRGSRRSKKTLRRSAVLVRSYECI